MSAPKKSKTVVSLKKKVIWKFPNFSKDFVAQYEEDAIESKKFIVSRGELSSEWSLELDPNATVTNPNTEEEESYVSVYLTDKSEDDSINYFVEFKVGVAKQDRKNDYVTEITSGSKEGMKDGIGYPNFLTHDELFDEKNGFIVDGTLTVFVDLKVNFEAVKPVKPQPKVSLSLSAYADYKKMFDNEAFSDLQIKTNDGKVLKAHKVVLAARSPVFYKMLTIDMEEQHIGSANVPDFDSKIMKEFLRFVYYNEVENLEDIAFDLIYAAEKYQIKELKEFCLEQIASMVEVANVIKALLLANLMSEADELFNTCSDLIIRCFDEVVKRPEWLEVPASLLTRIMKKSVDHCETLII